MKKLFKSKQFIIGGLAVLCVGILAVCLILNRNKKEEFLPDPPSTLNPVESWNENPSSSTGGGYTSPPQPPSDKKEEYPAIVDGGSEVSGGDAVIDFTPPEPIKPEPPSEPGKTEDHVDHEDVPSQPENNDGKPQETPKPGTPASGSTNDKGQVYDPVFGWVTPGKVDQKSIDNDGDPNKQVGEMD